MCGPLLVPPEQLLDLSQHPAPRHNADRADEPEFDALSGKVPGGRTRRAVLGVIRGIRSLKKLDSFEPLKPKNVSNFDIELTGLGELGGSKSHKTMPWVAADREEEIAVLRREKKPKVVTKAEKEIEEQELKKLRKMAKGATRKWVRAKKAGVTDEVVEEVKKVWRQKKGQEAMVAVKVVEPLKHCMDRARDIVEVKTGGLVIWSKKDVMVVYKNGTDLLPSNSMENDCLTEQDVSVPEADASIPLMGNGLPREPDYFNQPLYVREANRLLNSLGPRFIDWWWQTPLPVDADLLPEVICGFKTPPRQCPPGEKLMLRNEELTYLRMVARPLPTHFALGRNSKLQGLAAAIIKLWEKCPIAKIAVKVGIPSTNNEQMAKEIKRLTGGVLILRNKLFIILYRGKDFLPSGLAESISERERELRRQQVEEEEARSRAIVSSHKTDQVSSSTVCSGTFREYQDFEMNFVVENTQTSEVRIQLEAERQKLKNELKEQERKLQILAKKIEMSDKVLASLKSDPSEQIVDRELLTEEERQAFRRIGLKMDEHMLLGRRGIYDGVLQEIHQHWKHREIVKVITRQQRPQAVAYAAKLLEIESGGTLVAVEKLRSNHVIILYRGKNYSRPFNVLPRHLLTKRQALQRSLEAQRRGSLKYFARQRQQTIGELEEKLRTVEEKMTGNCSEFDAAAVVERS